MSIWKLAFVFIGSLVWHMVSRWLDIQALTTYEIQLDYANCENSISSLGEKKQSWVLKDSWLVISAYNFLRSFNACLCEWIIGFNVSWPREKHDRLSTRRPDTGNSTSQQSKGPTFRYAFISVPLVFSNEVETMSLSSQQPLQHLPALAAICDCAW